MNDGLKAQLEIAADVSGVETGVSKAKRSLADLGATAAAAGKQASNALASAGDGGADAAGKVEAASRDIVGSIRRAAGAGKDAGSALDGIGRGGKGAADKVDAATRNIIGSIERTTSALAAGSRSSSQYFEALAKQRGIDPEALRPYLDQLDAVIAKQRAAAAAPPVSTIGPEFIARLREQVAVAGKGEIELLKYKAAQAGVGQEAAALILQLQNVRAATQAKAEADAEGVRRARESAAAIRSQESAQKAFLASLQDRVATKGLSDEGLLRYRAAQLGITKEADALITKLAQTEHGTQAVGNTAKQTAAALRNVPAQFTDIIVSLQGGQAPLTVLLQQGGQLKDLFGGIGPAARALGGYVAGLINPFTVAAAAASVLAIAYYQGAAEGKEFAKALILTGGAAGKSAAQLADSARAVAETVGTVGKAAEVLAQLASTTNIDSTGLERYTEAAIKLEKYAGIAIGDTVKQFAELGKSPAEASAKLNESTNYLTASLYRQIRALELQGRTAEAGATAQKAYADSAIERAGQLAARLGLLERAWMGVGEFAKSAWDKMLNVGRPDTLTEQLAAAQRQLEAADAPTLRGRAPRISPETKEAIRDRIAALQESIKLEGRAASTQAANAARERAGINATQYIEKLRQQSDAQGRLNQALAEYKRNADAMAATGSPIDAAQQTKDLQALRNQYADKSGSAIYDANLSLLAAKDKAAADVRVQTIVDAEQRIQAAYGAGLLGVEQYEAQRLEIQRRKLDERAQLIADEIALEQRRKPQDAAGRLQKETKLVDLRSQAAGITAEQARLPLVAQAAVEQRALEDSRARMQEWAQSWQQTQQQIEQYAVQAATATAAMITDPLKRAQAEAEITASGIERQAQRIGVGLQSQIDQLTSGGFAAQASALQDQLDQLKASAAKAAENARNKPGQDFANALISKDIGFQVADGFDAASKSLSAFSRSFADLFKQQEDYNKARMQQGVTAEQLTKLDAQQARAQINAYGTMAGAAKGFFRAGTTGYKALEVAEKSFRAIELAESIKNAAVKTGLIDAETVLRVKGYAEQAGAAIASAAQQIGALFGIGTAAAATGVATQATGDPYTAFPRMAAMAAAMAALGFAVAGGGGKGASAPTNEGTGTVLGDSSAKSESVTKAIEALAQVDTATMRYSAQMLQSLRNIESNIGGLASLLVQSGDLGSAAAGVQTGTKQNVIGSSINAVSNALTLGLLPGVGKVLGNLFGSKTNVTGQGISANAQSLGSIQQRGFDASYYADIETKKKAFGITYSTKNSTQLTDASAETERQFGLILSGFADTVKAAGGPLGVNLNDLQQRINGFTVDIGRIDLQGLNGDQISEKLTAVFSAAGDKIARGVLPGLDAFQAVGEGYLQTVARVATGVETAGAALDGLGVRAIGFQALTQKQGDVGQSIVRQSLVEAETQQVYRLTRGMFGLIRTTVESSVSGIGQIISTLDGSAQELADTYKALTDVRTSLQLLGINGQAVSFALLKGAGGLDGLTAGVAAFEENFFTDQEKVTAQTARMRKQFELLGVAMPTTNDQFKALVQGTNTNTEAGQQLLGGLLGLSGGFAELTAAIEAAKEAGPASTVSAAMAATLQQRADLEQQLNDLVGGAEAVRRRELEAIDPSNRAIYLRIQALKDEQAAAAVIAQQRSGLEQQLMQLTGDTAAQRSRELMALAPVNRALQQRIYDLQDQRTAEQAAQKAATDAADKARSLSEAWRSVGGALQDEIARIQGLAGGGMTTTANAQAAFATATAQARAGDQTAAGQLAGLSRAMLDAAEESAGSLRELAAIRAATAQSLEQTLGLSAGYANRLAQQAGAITDNPLLIASAAADPTAVTLSAPASMAAPSNAQNAVLAELQALRLETQTLRNTVESFRAEQATHGAAIAGNTSRTTRILERVTPDGDALATRIAAPV